MARISEYPKGHFQAPKLMVSAEAYEIANMQNVAVGIADAAANVHSIEVSPVKDQSVWISHSTGLGVGVTAITLPFYWIRFTSGGGTPVVYLTKERRD